MSTLARSVLSRGLLASALSILIAPATADDGPGLGEPVDAETLAAFDFTILPNGDGLPPGSGSVADGRAIYAGQCIACHGADGKGSLNDALVGGQGTLATAEPQKTIGSYWPYATTVFDYVRRAMPLQSPGVLSDDDVYAVTAYLLYLNGIVGGDTSLDAKSLPMVKMPNRDGFTWAYDP